MPSNVARNNVFVEGLSFICMEEGYNWRMSLQDTDPGIGGMWEKAVEKREDLWHNIIIQLPKFRRFHAATY